MEEEHKEDKTTQTALQAGEQTQRESKRLSDQRGGREMETGDRARLARNGRATFFLFIPGVAGADPGLSIHEKTAFCAPFSHFPEISAFAPPGNH